MSSGQMRSDEVELKARLSMAASSQLQIPSLDLSHSFFLFSSSSVVSDNGKCSYGSEGFLLGNGGATMPMKT